MSIAPRPGMLRFDGDVAVFYMAICKQCDMALPHPTEMAREVWATGHCTTGHAVTYALDVRPDTSQTESRRRQLVDRLRKKYSVPMPALRGGVCGGKICNGEISYQQRYVSWAGKLWHAECLDDAVYFRIADITDIAPSIFDDVKPVTMQTWMPADKAWRDANPSYGRGLGPLTVIADPIAQHAGLLANMAEQLGATVAHVPPKKPNARERRRQRREGKQWQRKN